jgi:hypothetical protein
MGILLVVPSMNVGQQQAGKPVRRVRLATDESVRLADRMLNFHHFPMRRAIEGG